MSSIDSAVTEQPNAAADTIRLVANHWPVMAVPAWDRIIASLSAMKSRVPLVVSGDLHAIGLGRMLRTGRLDLGANPVNVALSGPIGTRPGGWPSARRGTGALPPTHIDLAEQIKPIEQHGFTIVDFTPDRIQMRFFKWDVNHEAVGNIDSLLPFHTAELPRPA